MFLLIEFSTDSLLKQFTFLFFFVLGFLPSFVLGRAILNQDV